jgi:hypothetical protein
MLKRFKWKLAPNKRLPVKLNTPSLLAEVWSSRDQRGVLRSGGAFEGRLSMLWDGFESR